MQILKLVICSRDLPFLIVSRKNTARTLKTHDILCARYLNEKWLQTHKTIEELTMTTKMVLIHIVFHLISTNTSLLYVRFFLFFIIQFDWDFN